jgi:hypothetical protein
LLAAIIGTVVGEAALNGVDALLPEQLNALFDAAANEPALAALMVNGNEELANQLANTNDANALFSSTTGLKIDPDAPCTKEIIEQIATLDTMSVDEFNFHSNPALVNQGAVVQDRTNAESPVI